ncbi:cysteine-rich RECEPTOR-like protein kinase 29 [Prunus dulcis]|uniref:Cysteine-rich RECEPTOR-like protein kinase 29 n=1 Tax=Prunus dulcis TaxID=3755 RepID=A0A4Y1RB26_PRUDU|nr:cysteine-rich RECEPTOR-like protein kinase 29 [Prunus dulcis]
MESMEKLEGKYISKHHRSCVDEKFTKGNDEMHPHWFTVCVQENAVDRPTMASVASMLNSESLAPPVPSQPAFCKHTTSSPLHMYQNMSLQILLNHIPLVVEYQSFVGNFLLQMQIGIYR